MREKDFHDGACAGPVVTEMRLEELDHALTDDRVDNVVPLLHELRGKSLADKRQEFGGCGTDRRRWSARKHGRTQRNESWEMGKENSRKLPLCTLLQHLAK